MIHLDRYNILKKLKQTESLKESPDRVHTPSGQMGHWAAEDAKAFGYLNNKKFGQLQNKMVVGGARYTHGDIATFYAEEDEFSVSRRDFDYAGRYWTKAKVISFWDYPPKNMLKSLIKHIEQVSGDKIWNNGYHIEIIDDNGKYFNPMRDVDSSDWDEYFLSQVSSKNFKIRLIPLESYTGSDEQKDKGKDHFKPPTQKKKKVVPPNMRNARIKKRGNMKQRFLTRKGMGDSVEKNGTLLENPDRMVTGGYDLSFTDSEARAFGIYKGRAYLSDEGDPHHTIRNSDHTMNKLPKHFKDIVSRGDKITKAAPQLTRFENTMKDFQKMVSQYDKGELESYYDSRNRAYWISMAKRYKDRIKELENLEPLSVKEMAIYEKWNELPFTRDQWTYPGRVWTRSKIISFWEYPKTKSELLKTIKAVEKSLGKRIVGANWKLEIVDKDDMWKTDLVDVDSDYDGSGEQRGKDKSHVLPPTLKKKKAVPMNVLKARNKKFGDIKSRFLAMKGLGDSYQPMGTLLENPDTISASNAPNSSISFRDDDARSFGSYKNNVYVAKDSSAYHYSLSMNFINPQGFNYKFLRQKERDYERLKYQLKQIEDRLKQNKSNSVHTKGGKLPSVGQYSHEEYKARAEFLKLEMEEAKLTKKEMEFIELSEQLPNDRSGWDFPGRIWTKQKVLSFWRYPKTKSHLMKIIKQLERQLKIKIIGANFKLEVLTDGSEEQGNYDAKETSLIDPKNYKGSSDQHGGAHVESPMLKKRNTADMAKLRNIIKTRDKRFGSFKKRYMARRGLGDSVEKLGKIIKEIKRIKGK